MLCFCKVKLLLRNFHDHEQISKHWFESASCIWFLISNGICLSTWLRHRSYKWQLPATQTGEYGHKVHIADTLLLPGLRPRGGLYQCCMEHAATFSPRKGVHAMPGERGEPRMPAGSGLQSATLMSCGEQSTSHISSSAKAKGRWLPGYSTAANAHGHTSDAG